MNSTRLPNGSRNSKSAAFGNRKRVDHLQPGRPQSITPCVQIADRIRDMSLGRVSARAVFGADMNLAITGLEPEASATLEFLRFLDLGEPKQAAVECPRGLDIRRANRDLDVVNPENQRMTCPRHFRLHAAHRLVLEIIPPWGPVVFLPSVTDPREVSVGDIDLGQLDPCPFLRRPERQDEYRIDVPIGPVHRSPGLDDQLAAARYAESSRRSCRRRLETARRGVARWSRETL